MADKSIVDSCQHFPADASRQQSLKGMTGSDNSIPLSPQWLQTKSGDNKEHHTSMCHGEHVDSMKGSTIGEDFHERGKRKDVYKLVLHDTETGSRDRWRDEERETNSAIRRDQRGERWSENSQRFSGEACHTLSERSELGNREGSFDQRRESKWNTRWGPADKESESWREKWPESVRDVEGPREKMSHLTSFGRDSDKEGEQHSRSWRSNSFMSRGKAETYHPSLTPNKQTHMFGYGRGKGENGAPLSPAGRGRFNSGNATSGALRPYHLGAMSAKFDGVHSGSSPLRYSRMKLLDIYRMTDIRSHKISLDGIIEVSSLTQSEPLEPLALSAPTNEELVILKAIDKGEISSSGVPLVSKESTVGRNAVDPAVPNQMKLGSQDDLQFVGVDYTNYGCESKKNYDAISPKVDPAKRAGTPFKKADNLTGEMGMPDSRFPHNVAPWRSLSTDSSQWSSPDWRNSSSELAARPSDVNWSHLSNDLENEASRAAVSSSFCKDESSWQNSENRSNLKGYASEVSDREQSANLFIAPEASLSSWVQPTSRNFQPYPSPEELSLYYKDPHGQVQGPFSGSDLIGWFEAGYFGIDLEVRLAGAPPDAPFLFLGDVIPQLRLKVRAPPGFSAAKQSNILDMSIGEKTGSTYSGGSGYELSKSGQRSGILVSTEAENKFLESRMFANMSSSTVGNLSEGLHSYGEHGPGYSSSVVGESGNGVNYLLAQMKLEQQRNSLNNSMPFVSGKDSSLMALNMEITADSPDPYLKVMPLTGNPSHLATQSLPQSDLLSLLHAGQVDKSPSLAVISGASAWSKLPDAQVLNNNVHAGLDIHKNKLDIHQNQYPSSQFGFVVQQQQQQLQPQNLPSLSHLINKPVDLSGLLPYEQLLASDAVQDPQMLNLLVQQYLLSQPPIPQPQVSLPSQLSLLNECLLLKQQLQQQQQNQEQQKQLLLQQQQFLLSQVLSGHQSGQQHFVEASQKLHSAVPEGNVPNDHLQLQQIQEAQVNQNIPAGNLHDVHGSSIQTANLQDSEYTNNSFKCEPSLLHLPHQIFDHGSHSKAHESGLQSVGDNGASHLSLTAGIGETLSVSYALQKTENNFPATENAIDHKKYVKETSTSMPESREFMPSECSVSPQEIPGASGFVSPISDQSHDLKISSYDIIDQHHADVSSIKDSKNLDTFQAKKSAKKKSRKKKNSKSQLAMDLLMGFSNANQLEQPKPKLETIQFEQPKSKIETDDANSHGLSAAHTNLLKPPHALLTAVDDLSTSSAVKPMYSTQSHFTPSCTNMDREVENLNNKAESTEGSISESSNLRAWKSAPGVKAKSLKEIQQEEQQQRVKMASEIDRFPPTGLVSSPWTGVVGSSDHKAGKDTSQGAFSTEYNSSSDSNLISKTSKSQLHDLLAEEVLAESSEGDAGLASDNKGQLLPFVSSTADQLDVAAINDENFIEAKDTKKGRKKGSKAKAAGAKASSPVGSFDLPSSPLAAEKGKFEDQAQHENEMLPAPSTGPSLADFVFWKGEQINSSKAPAWSMDSGKFQKPTSLRDIQKEQEKKLSVHQNIGIPSTEKAQSNQGNRRLGSLQVPVSSPSSGSTPIQSSSLASSQLKPKIEGELFWGPSDQSKQETVKSDFPSLGNSNTWGAKGSPTRASPVAISRQKPSGYRAGDHSPSATGFISSSSRGKKDDEPGNLSEAMGFRGWCEKELARLTGLNDTSFLEYCLKQSTTEAEILLKENIGSLDRNHEFIDKFLSYKDLLSPKVIEMAFQARPASDNRDAGAALNLDADAEVGKGGNKKGKKGKKVSPAVLGFNVASNRIMMGEIQTAED